MDSISSILLAEISLISISSGIIVASLLALWLTRKKPKRTIDVNAAVRNAPYHLLGDAGIPIARIKC